jgi:lipopolysaccharide transport system ATP-binding protein
LKDIILKPKTFQAIPVRQVGMGSLSHDLNRWWHQVQEDPYLQIGDLNDRATKGESDYVRALQDINFEVERGEVQELLEKWCGKIDLIKNFIRVTVPTGSIKFGGRVASLLEVGTGFNGEMTGRENIFEWCDLRNDQKLALLDEIIEFSGCARYIDTPVKRYSRDVCAFGFAVAAFRNRFDYR